MIESLKSAARSRGRIGGQSDEEEYMPRPTVMVDLAPEVYDELRQRADHHQRLLEEEASLALTAAVTTSFVPASDLETALVALTNLDNDVLWQVSHSQPTVEDGILFHALIEIRK